MKLKKGNIVTEITHPGIIDAYISNGWVEVKEETEQPTEKKPAPKTSSKTTTKKTASKK